MFGLTAAHVVERARSSADKVSAPTLGESLLFASLGFLGASLLVYGSVAFAGRWMYGTLGEGLAYAVWAALFILAGGAALGRVVIGPGRTGRFYALFCVAFFLYAAGWVAAYFTLRNAWGELLGSLAGTLMIAIVFAWGFGAWDRLLKMWLVLFISHTVGYFLGSILNSTIGDKTGMMMWGVSYGWIFGLGLGYALYAAQRRTRNALTELGENRI
ncbi:MAG TPA: hypothetical protein VKA70_05560 [Blastocatellia bacterium]|nr:hypothetical protein [Blastocatellia bacterium]